MRLRSTALQLAGGLALAGPVGLLAQGEPPALRGAVERIQVHGDGLAGNLSSDSPDRHVAVYLPPSYKTDPDRRYPVVYMLHGFTDSQAKWFSTTHWINLPAVIEQALGDENVREMIVVMPDAFTRFEGSMYSSSVTTGDWEGFIARELVGYIDSHYRTLASRASRGLAGHSMGGYGTLRIGMKHPEAFSSIYALSPCCLIPNDFSNEAGAARMAKVAEVRTVEQIAESDFGTKAMLASAAAWSPNPDKPPFYIDLPWENGEYKPMVAAKWAANAPLAMVDQYVPNLKQLDAIAFDAGDEDRGIAASIRVLDEMLNRLDIPHVFEIYEGDHVNRVAERIATKALQFFSENIEFEE